jgi:carbonic anhydrase/acetyltransferase-like protein (isoleucine patch superfamily)
VIRDYDGKFPVIDLTALITETAVLIGDVTIGPESSIWYGAVLRGDDQPIVIGAQTNIQDLAMLHDRVTIGDRVSVGHGAILHSCTIEDDCLIGMGAIILNGAVIGQGSMVAAGSLVLSRTIIEPGTLYAGNPAVYKKHLSTESTAHNRRTIENHLQRSAKYRQSTDEKQV